MAGSEKLRVKDIDDKLSRLSAIKVDVARPIDMQNDCIDPLAKLVLVEALDYCLETSVSRLDSMGKIFSVPVGPAEKSLALINSIRNSILELKTCEVVQSKEPAPVAPLPPVQTIPSPPAAHQATSVQTPIQPGTSAQAQPPTQTSPPAETAKKGIPKQRTLAEKWGTAYYQGKSYDSPNELAVKLGLKVKGYHSVVEAFQKQGYEVYGEKPGTEPVKGGKFNVVKKGGAPVRPPAPPKEEPPKGGTSPVKTYQAAPPPPAKPLDPQVELGAAAVWAGLPVDQRSSLASMAGLEGKLGAADWTKLTVDEKTKIADRIFARTQAAQAKKTEPVKPAAPPMAEARIIKPLKVTKHHMKSSQTWVVRLMTEDGERFTKLFPQVAAASAETYAQELARRHNVKIEET